MEIKSLVARRNRRGAEAESRVAAVLEVARRQFMKKGYALTSLNDVLAQAGGSKVTLLKYFKNKAGLFGAVIAAVSQRFVATAHFSDLEGTPEQVLRKFGVKVLEFYLAHDALLTYRGVIGEGHRYPAMAARFYREGHARVAAALAERLATWRSQGLVHCADSADAASLFLHMVRAGVYEESLLGVRKRHTHAEVVRRVNGAVAIFLRGIAVRRR